MNWLIKNQRNGAAVSRQHKLRIFSRSIVVIVSVLVLQACSDGNNSSDNGASLASCEGFSTESGQFPERTLFSGGMDRYYSLKVPTVTDPLQPLPLVFDFHGFGSNKEQQAVTLSLAPLSRKSNSFSSHPTA